MFRNFGSAFVHRFALTGFGGRWVGPAIVAALLSSFTAFGCGSSNNTDTDAATQPTNCDLTQLGTLFTKRLCSSAGCHDPSGTSASLNLTADSGLAGRLVGKNPAGGGALPALCANLTPPKVYLVAGSQPATGLLLDKLTSTPGCGVRMPYMTGVPLTADEIACVQSWATSVTK